MGARAAASRKEHTRFERLAQSVTPVFTALKTLAPAGIAPNGLRLSAPARASAAAAG